MVWFIVALALSASATTTTIDVPESPAAGLSLDHPVVTPGPAPEAPSLPTPGSPSGSPLTTWAAMTVGMAVLAARARRISQGRAAVRDALQDNLFHDVGHSDLVTIARTITALEPGEANAVVATLSDQELRVWMRELDGWRGGFRRAEESALFTALVTRLEPAQLVRLAAIGKTRELLASAEMAAPSRARAETALGLWERLHPSHEDWDGVVELFEAADPSDQESVVARAAPDTLMVNLLGVHLGPSDEPRLSLDTIDRFLVAAAAFQDPAVKARIFVAGQGALHGARKLHATGEPAMAYGRLGGLVRSDPSRVIMHLSHDVDPHGEAFSQWVGSMIEADRLDELDALLADLLGGPDRLAHYTVPGTDPARPYPNAANLGYFVGAYSLAIDDIADDAEDQVTLVGQLFSIVTGLVPGPDDSWIRLPIGPLVDAHSHSVVDGLRSQATSLKQTLWGLAKPRTSDGLLWNGAGTTQFQDAWEEVVVVR